MRGIKFLGIALLFFFSYALLGQNQNLIWYFGNGAGLDFSSGVPIALTNGNLYTEEGSATVCDENGNLLFYTNGVKVWNKNHEVMPNGNLLLGHISSTQSALVVKKINTNSQYYIFTVGEKGAQPGLNYSIVDMTKDRATNIERIKNNALKTPDIDLSFGNGDIILKNKNLISYTSEKLTAISHKNGKDVWILTHKWNSNQFLAYLITEKGIDSPIITAIGSSHMDYGSKNNGEAIGYLVASPNGKMIASAMCYSTNAAIELFDFDNETGKLFNLREIQTGGFAYGVCFSPNNQFLYTTFLKGAVGIKQYDLSYSDPFDSEEVIARNSPDNFFGALQLAPDGKIYIAKVGTEIDVINSPNEKGIACNYKQSAVNLNGRYCVYGLPNIFNSNSLKLPLPVETKKELAVKEVASEKVKENISKEKAVLNNDIQKNPITLKESYEVGCEEKLELDCGVANAEYLWSTKEEVRKINVQESNYYTVTVTLNGQSYTKRTYVDIKSRPTKINYLKEFEPQNPLFNNYFSINANDVESFELKIFSPKGKLVFASTSQKNMWLGKDEKGKIYPTGIYRWEVTFKAKCDSKTKTETGTVKLIN